MHCADVSTGTVEITTLQEYVNVLVRGGHARGSLVLEHPSESDETPASRMARVALGVARGLLGDFDTWDLRALTHDAWAAVQGCMEATGWRVCVAAEGHIDGVSKELSDRVSGFWLWQEDDVPAAAPVKYVPQFGMLLWCVPL
jgi:hypothetical protein